MSRVFVHHPEACARARGRASATRAAALLALACVVCAAAAFSLSGCQAQGGADAGGRAAVESDTTRGAVQGRPAPDAPLALLDGSTKNISDFQGAVTIVSFWGTWCPYCIKEMPDLQKIGENYPDVNVVLVNCGESASVVSDFAEQQGYDFVWALDPDYEAQRAYPTSGIPYTVVIDAQGTVSEIFAGSGRDMYAKFESAVQKAMG